MDNIKQRDSGLPYISDISVFKEQIKAKKLLYELNTTDYSDFKKIQSILDKLISGSKKNLMILPPFYCDYGFHIEVGDNFFANYNCTILDEARVKIGNNVLLAPNVSIYTSGHPLHPAARVAGYEYAFPIIIGNNVWIGGNSVITPGISIGDNVVIGAGSVVTKDIPSNVIAVGNPCRVLRKISENDIKYYYKNNLFDNETMQSIESKTDYFLSEDD